MHADLVARYPEAVGWSRLGKGLRFLRDPSLRAVMMFRLISRAPGRLVLLGRIWMIARYRCEVFKCEIGPGLRLPYPLGIVIAHGVKLGSGVTLHNCVTLGTARAPGPGQMLPVPEIGDRVTVGPGSVVAGPVAVGAGATIGACAVVARDVPPGARVGSR